MGQGYLLSRYGIPILNSDNFFSAALSRDRFNLIYRTLRFDDKTTRLERISSSGDKLEAFREIFDIVDLSFRENYSLDKYITVDERMVGFKGNCSFRIYMKGKPQRYSMKVWVAADVKTSYLLNIQPYLGKVGGAREIKQGERVVKDLMEPYYGTCRGLTTDNFFTSIPLAIFLLNNNITLTGTMRRNNTYIPPKILDVKHRQELSSVFCYSGDLTLVSYVPKKIAT